MTNKRAAQVVQAVKFLLDNGQYTEEVEEALDLAIKALEEQERPTGERSGLADIRWTDKVSIDADGNIRDFDGNILYSIRNEYGEEAENDSSK